MVARCARGPNRDGGPRERCRRRNWFAVGGDFSWLSEEDHWHDFHNVVAVQWGQPVFEAPVIFDAKRNVAAISSVGKRWMLPTEVPLWKMICARAGNGWCCDACCSPAAIAETHSSMRASGIIQRQNGVVCTRSASPGEISYAESRRRYRGRRFVVSHP